MDRTGRRALLLTSFGGMAACLAALSAFMLLPSESLFFRFCGGGWGCWGSGGLGAAGCDDLSKRESSVLVVRREGPLPFGRHTPVATAASLVQHCHSCLDRRPSLRSTQGVGRALLSGRHPGVHRLFCARRWVRLHASLACLAPWPGSSPPQIALPCGSVCHMVRACSSPCWHSLLCPSCCPLQAHPLAVHA